MSLRKNKYNRNSIADTCRACRRRVDSDQITRYVVATALGYTITKDNPKSLGQNHVSIEFNCPLIMHERNFEQQTWQSRAIYGVS